MPKHLITAAVFTALFAAGVQAKLPPLSDEAKAKAAEAAARTAWSNSVANFQLCKSMDKVAAAYLAEAKKGGKAPTPTATPPCTDPGPFVYTPPEAKPPLEASGAHSPAKTAAAPPSTNAPQAAAPAATTATAPAAPVKK